jgi:transposase
MKKADLLEDTISDDEIARAYGVSRATVRRWAALGRLPPKVGPGREPRRNRAAVRKALTGQSGEAAPNRAA